MAESIVREKSIKFAFKVIDLYKKLVAQNEYVLSKQILKSGTSIGANIHEALAGYSKKDFGAKMSISLKESNETDYWLTLLDYAEFVEHDYQDLKNDNSELTRMLASIVKTTKQNIGYK